MSGPSSDFARAVPDLRIVPIESVVPHEHHDDQRLEPLVERLRYEDTLINPPVVSELDDGRFVVLDGANRVTALAELNYPHCLVQVVPYEKPHVELRTWFHAVTGMDVAALDKAITDIKGITIEDSDLLHARAGLARRVLLTYYVRADGSVVTVTGSHDLFKRTDRLNQIVSIYLSAGRLHRVSTDDVTELQMLFPDLCAVVVFPNYEPVEIQELASDGIRIPPGITRHIINGRALRINYPLDTLTAPTTLEKKNAALQDWIRSKMSDKRVRYYAETTFLFDE